MNVLALPFRVALLIVALLGAGALPARAADSGFAVASFTADVTIPVGHAMVGGGNYYSSVVVDPLYAKGVVLFGGGAPTSRNAAWIAFATAPRSAPWMFAVSETTRARL